MIRKEDTYEFVFHGFKCYWNDLIFYKDFDVAERFFDEIGIRTKKIFFSQKNLKFFN